MNETTFKNRQTAYKYSVGMILKGIPKIVDNRFQSQEINGASIVRVNLIGTVINKFISNQKPYSNLTIDDGTGNIRLKAFADNAPMLMPFEIGDSIKTIGLIRFFNDEIYVVPEIVIPVDSKWMMVRKLELTKEFGQLYHDSIFEKEENPIKSEDKTESLEIEDELNPTKTFTPYSKKEDTSNFEQKIKDNQTKLSDKNENYQEDHVEEINPEVEKISMNIENKNSQGDLKQQILSKLKENDSQGGIDMDKLILELTAPVDQINAIILEFLEDGIIYEPRPGRIQLL